MLFGVPTNINETSKTIFPQTRLHGTRCLRNIMICYNSGIALTVIIFFRLGHSWYKDFFPDMVENYLCENYSKKDNNSDISKLKEIKKKDFKK